MNELEYGKTGVPCGTNNFDTDDDTQFALNLQQASIISRSCMTAKQMCFRTKHAYFAGPWFDERAEALYDCCKQIVDFGRLVSQYDIYFPKYEVSNRPLDAFVRNVVEIEKSDMVLALVSRKDVGTAWEIGMAYALNKKIILLGYDETTFLSHTNAMLAFCAECATISDLGNILLDEPFSKITIKNEWEGIE